MFWTIVLVLTVSAAILSVVHHIVGRKLYPKFMLSEVKYHDGKVCKQSGCNPKRIRSSYQGLYSLYSDPDAWQPIYSRDSEDAEMRIESCIKENAAKQSKQWIRTLRHYSSSGRETKTYKNAVSTAASDKVREAELARREREVERIVDELRVTDAEKFDRILSEAEPKRRTR